MRSGRLTYGINTEYEKSGFIPLGSITLRVEETTIGREMFFVVFRQCGCAGCPRWQLGRQGHFCACFLRGFSASPARTGAETVAHMRLKYGEIAGVTQPLRPARQEAGRGGLITGTVDDDAFSGLPQHAKKLEIMTDFPSSTGFDPHGDRLAKETCEVTCWACDNNRP